jgi:hypothetical protein
MVGNRLGVPTDAVESAAAPTNLLRGRAGRWSHRTDPSSGHRGCEALPRAQTNPLMMCDPFDHVRQIEQGEDITAIAVLPGLGMAVLMSYVIGSPFVLREGYGLSTNQFALLFAMNGVALVGGAQINASLVRRVAPIRILRCALPLLLVAAVVLLIISLTRAGGLFGLLAALWVTLGLIQFIPPNASAIALSRHGAIAGTAAAFIGAMQAGVAGVVSPLVGVLGSDARAMCLVMIASATAALLILATATPAYRRGGWLQLEGFTTPPPGQPPREAPTRA